MVLAGLDLVIFAGLVAFAVRDGLVRRWSR